MKTMDTIMIASPLPPLPPTNIVFNDKGYLEHKHIATLFFGGRGGGKISDAEDVMVSLHFWLMKFSQLFWPQLKLVKTIIMSQAN